VLYDSSKIDFGLFRCLEPNPACNLSQPHNRAMVIGSDRFDNGIESRSRQEKDAAAVASVVGALRRRVSAKGPFKYKNAEYINHLISPNPKRHIPAVNRQYQAVNRQNLPALLAFICQALVCLEHFHLSCSV
jgi:hypothetical protein